MKQWLSMMKDYQREKFMYENVMWHLDNYPDARIAIIGHDAHITKNPKQKGSGTFLAETLGKKYFTVSFSTADGNYFGYDMNQQKFSIGTILPPAPESIESLFMRAKIKKGYVVLKDKASLPAWFNRDLSALGIGFAITNDQTYTIERSVGIKNYFDAFFFIQSTSASLNYLRK